MNDLSQTGIIIKKYPGNYVDLNVQGKFFSRVPLKGNSAPGNQVNFYLSGYAEAVNPLKPFSGKTNIITFNTPSSSSDVGRLEEHPQRFPFINGVTGFKSWTELSGHESRVRKFTHTSVPPNFQVSNPFAESNVTLTQFKYLGELYSVNHVVAQSSANYPTLRVITASKPSVLSISIIHYILNNPPEGQPISGDEPVYNNSFTSVQLEVDLGLHIKGLWSSGAPYGSTIHPDLIKLCDIKSFVLLKSEVPGNIQKLDEVMLTSSRNGIFVSIDNSDFKYGYCEHISEYEEYIVIRFAYISMLYNPSAFAEDYFPFTGDPIYSVSSAIHWVLDDPEVNIFDLAVRPDNGTDSLLNFPASSGTWEYGLYKQHLAPNTSYALSPRLPGALIYNSTFTEEQVTLINESVRGRLKLDHPWPVLPYPQPVPENPPLLAGRPQNEGINFEPTFYSVFETGTWKSLSTTTNDPNPYNPAVITTEEIVGSSSRECPIVYKDVDYSNFSSIKHLCHKFSMILPAAYSKISEGTPAPAFVSNAELLLERYFEDGAGSVIELTDTAPIYIGFEGSSSVRRLDRANTTVRIPLSEATVLYSQTLNGGLSSPGYPDSNVLPVSYVGSCKLELRRIEVYIPPFPVTEVDGTLVKRASGPDGNFYRYEGSIYVQGVLEVPGDPQTLPPLTSDSPDNDEFKFIVNMMPLKRK